MAAQAAGVRTPLVTSIGQRAQDLAKAKSLLAAAGHGSGFTTQLATEDIQEIPNHAQIVAQSAAAIGVKIFGYFYNYLTATAQGVTGVYPTAIGHLFWTRPARARAS